MLCGGCCSAWTVPQALLTPGVDFPDGAAHYLAERFRITEPRFGSVYGVRETQGFMISDSRSRVVFTDDEVPIAVLISENELTECEEARAVVQRQLQSDAHRVPDDEALPKDPPGEEPHRDEEHWGDT
ncbi:hypothetical protein ABZS71_14655 [Streptomyces sp. NPDC005393]|uniref:hypothetical protein n=1 Tax=Streptomyces sp. NPDC005393 TaxID=3157041 RepID=UPI0033BCE749